jgi:hypothetical protein
MTSLHTMIFSVGFASRQYRNFTYGKDDGQTAGLSEVARLATRLSKRLFMVIPVSCPHAGIDNQSAPAVKEHQEQTIQKLEQELRAGQYRPKAVKRFMDTQAWEPREAPVRSTDGGFILHLIQRPFGIGRILIRRELVTHALNSDSFCGSMLIQ